jgi:periplasmic divalent cation tolerance protein
VNGVQVATTAASREAVQHLADTVVTERLAACAQVEGPLASVYRWQGGVERVTEWRCLCKTTAARAPALIARLRALHPYDVPEIVATPIVDGDPDYLAWIEHSVSPER